MWRLKPRHKAGGRPARATPFACYGDSHTNAKGNTMNAPMKTLRALPTEQDPRWAAVVARERSADGSFYYSVSTTGVYCRPSCPPRLAKPSNVRFHRTRADAERAGVRPCESCEPGQFPVAAVAFLETPVAARAEA